MSRLFMISIVARSIRTLKFFIRPISACQLDEGMVALAADGFHSSQALYQQELQKLKRSVTQSPSGRYIVNSSKLGKTNLSTRAPHGLIRINTKLNLIACCNSFLFYITPSCVFDIYLVEPFICELVFLSLLSHMNTLVTHIMDSIFI